MKKVLAIVRASTDAQETQSQKKEVIEFVRTKGYKTEEILTLERAGASARSLNKSYLEFIEEIKTIIETQKSIEAVALWSLDRLGRVDTILIEMKNYFVSHKIQVYVKNPSITLLTASGDVDGGAEIAWGVFATMVKQQTEDIFNKFKRGKERNKTLNRWNGGSKHKILYGYTLDENNYIIVDEEESAIIRKIFQLYSSGKYSLDSLTKEFDEQGITLRGKTITINLLCKVIDNKAYYGELNKCGRKYTPIITEELYKKCEVIRKANNKCITKSTKYVCLCSKLLKCPICGTNLSKHMKYYSCHIHNQNIYIKNFRTCSFNEEINIDVLDSIVWDVASHKYLDYLLNNGNNREDDIKENISIVKSKLVQCNKQIDDIDIKQKRLLDAYLDNALLSQVEFNKRKQKLQSEFVSVNDKIKAYKKQIEDLNRQISSLHSDNKTIKMMLETNRITDVKQKFDIVHKFIKKVEFANDKFNGYCSNYITITDIEDKVYKYVYQFKNPHYLSRCYCWDGSNYVPSPITQELFLDRKDYCYEFNNFNAFEDVMKQMAQDYEIEHPEFEEQITED